MSDMFLNTYGRALPCTRSSKYSVIGVGSYAVTISVMELERGRFELYVLFSSLALRTFSLRPFFP